MGLHQHDPPGRGAATSSVGRAPKGEVCLVAVDGSVASAPALGWALRHALSHGMRVEVLTVWPPFRSPLIHDVPGHFCLPRWSAERAQQDVVTHALEDVPAGSILSARLENGDVAERIVEASASCQLVVLGSSSPDGVQELTSLISADVACAVVVVDDQGGVSSAKRRTEGPARFGTPTLTATGPSVWDGDVPPPPPRTH